MKITDVEPIVVSWPPFENSFWTSLNKIGQVSELVVLVHTDEGLVGIGEAHGGSMHYIDNLGVAHISGAGSTVTDILKPLLIGEDPLENERLWSKMFALTYQKGWSQINTVRHFYCIFQMSLETSGVKGSKNEFLTVVSQWIPIFQYCRTRSPSKETRPQT